VLPDVTVKTEPHFDPKDVAKEIFPLVAPVGTTARNWVGDRTVKLAADRPLNRTHKRPPSKFWPVTVTTVPAGPEVGVMEANVGGAGAACDTEAPVSPIRIAAPATIVFALERQRRPSGFELDVVRVLVLLISTAFRKWDAVTRSDALSPRQSADRSPAAIPPCG
jgi:hypothetical protein